MENKPYTILFIDDICPVCNRFAEFVFINDTQKIFYFADLKLVTENRNTVLLFHNGKIYDQSTAILKILNQLNGIYKISYLGYIFPPFFRNSIYNLFANYRLRFLKKNRKCSLEMRSRLLTKGDLNDHSVFQVLKCK